MICFSRPPGWQQRTRQTEDTGAVPIYDSALNQELQDSCEQPTRVRAQSGLFSA
jgi:hypothetical protein